MSPRSIIRAVSAAGVLLFAAACGSDSPTQLDLPLDLPAGPEGLVAPPSGDAVELLVNIASPNATSGNPPYFSLSSLPTTVEAGTTWSRTISIDPNSPFAPQVAVDYGDGSGAKAVAVNQSGGETVWTIVNGVPVPGETTPVSYSFTLSHTYTSAGTRTVRVAAETFGDQPGTRIESRTITATPDLNLYIKNFQITSPVKAGWPATFSFEAQGPGEDLFSWNVDYDDNLKQSGFVPPGDSRTMTHTWKNAGTYTLVITISNGDRTATLTRQVTVAQTPITIEDYYVTPQVNEGDAIQYRFKVMGPGSGPYTVHVTPEVVWADGGETPVVHTVSPGATVSGTLALESGFYHVVTQGFAEGLEGQRFGKFIEVMRTPPSIVDLQIPATAHVGEEVAITFLAVDATENATYKAWAITWKPAGTPDPEDWGSNQLVETFEGNEHQVEARITFDAPGGHEVLVLVGSDKNSLLVVDSVRATITVTERPDVTCEPGSYKVGYECVDAPAGSYVPEAGADEETLCPAGTFSASAGQTACEPAPAGSFVSEAGQTHATLCAVGTAQSLTGQNSCLPAPAGSYVDVTGATQATLCPAGTYQASTGSFSCIKAQPGSYVPVAGATDDTPCAAGTFSATAGQASCDPAPAGTFVAEAGQTQATMCAAGTFQPEAGQTHCITAPVGTYVDAMGASETISCPAGTSTMGTGSTSASACLSVGNVAVNRIDEAVSTGGLVPAQAGRGGQNQFDNWVASVKRSVQFLQGPQRQAGCVGIRNALAEMAGPRAVVTGPAQAATASDLQWVMTENGCSTGR